MRLIQDCTNRLYPSDEDAARAVKHLNETLPQYRTTIVSGAVGDWRMLPNGETVFYCPPVYLPD